jgi:hypothetical protein
MTSFGYNVFDGEEDGFVDAVEDLYQNMFVPSSEHKS